ncbi:MAG: hypothetical protein EX269_15730 [Acidimicrobiales bacterium]|nr:MAG: hypothetical protein EX269_15730 [Acidimicrobiales bacterium]
MYYETMTARARKPAVTAIVLALLAVLFVTTAQSRADGGDVVVSSAAAQTAANVAERDAQILALREQLAFVQQATLMSEARADDQAAMISELEGTALLGGGPLVERQMDEWRVGYYLGGGRNLAAFENTILPCESGTQPDPFAAISRTDDWGRAQINRRTWAPRFAELTGRQFEDWILDPMLNGYMAGIVENEHFGGLNAWTCWRRR